MQARQFFESRGVRTLGDITLTVDERNRFQTYCCTNPEQRQEVEATVECTVRLVDELVVTIAPQVHLTHNSQELGNALADFSSQLLACTLQRRTIG